MQDVLFVLGAAGVMVVLLGLVALPRVFEGLARNAQNNTIAVFFQGCAWACVTLAAVGGVGAFGFMVVVAWEALTGGSVQFCDTPMCVGD